MSGEKVAPPPAPVKYSRYRSVRQQAEAVKAPPPVQEKSENVTVARSMSRYRRPKSIIPKDAQATIPQSLPPMPAIPRATEMNTTRRVTEPIPSPGKAPGNYRLGARQQRTRETETERLQRKARDIREQEEQQLRAEKELAERKRKVELEKENLEAEQARLANELLTEQKRKDLERLEAELDAAPSPPPRIESPKEGRFGFFTRKRAATKATSLSGSRSTTEEPRTRSQDAVTRATEQVNFAPSLTRERSLEPPRIVIESIGIPGNDAPISAVNAGERRVLIRCKQSSINLPVTPDTSPLDLVYSAANIMTQNITPSTAILLESYTQLGFERRIRRYEHIRDVMNSWDRDTQNALILQNSDDPKGDLDLRAQYVPREPPSVSIYMYHSQKPGKWNKRYITLLSTGQIYLAKKLGAKPSDKDVVNICHLSDFDIYTPTPQQIRKNLKPPKKYCHAIKSQQKTTMFLSTENFVHFFCTDEERLAQQWYDAVQEWRSWYLVNKKGEGDKKKSRTVAGLVTDRGPIHKVKVSVDESPYTIGTFSPLLDLDRFSPTPARQKSEPDEYDSEDESRLRQIPFHLRNSISLQPVNSKYDSKRHPPPVMYRVPVESPPEFASDGLLGRTYSQRQKAVQAASKNDDLPSQPFLDGPSLLNDNIPPKSAHHRTLSTKSVKRPETSGGRRLELSGGRELPKPLLDFTPTFKEAPQWDKTGQGRGVAPPVSGHLVDVATTPEVLGDFPKTLLRREPTGKRPRTAVAAEGAFIKGGLISGL